MCVGCIYSKMLSCGTGKANTVSSCTAAPEVVEEESRRRERKKKPPKKVKEAQLPSVQVPRSSRSVI